MHINATLELTCCIANYSWWAPPCGNHMRIYYDIDIRYYWCIYAHYTCITNIPILSSGWWFGTFFIFHILGIIIPTD